MTAGWTTRPFTSFDRLHGRAHHSRVAAEEDGADRRKFTRVPIQLKVEYKRLNSFFADYTRNISRGGTFIRTQKPLDIGTEFVFQLVVPKLPKALELRGRVQWVVQPNEGQDPGM